MARGNEKKNIFIDDYDRNKYLDIIYEKKKNNAFLLYSYCLMDNHLHLLLKEESLDISNIMKRLNTSYASYFNRKYDRVGHVFQDRFRSEPIEKETYLLAVLRYIHNNPVKAGMVKNLSDYKWSSYFDYILEDDYAKGKSLVDCENILELFSRNTSKAVQYFIDFSKQDNEDVFLDIDDGNEEYERGNYVQLNHHNVRAFVNAFLNMRNIRGSLKDKNNRTAREDLIKTLKQQSNLSAREIADYLELSKGMVLRVK